MIKGSTRVAVALINDHSMAFVLCIHMCVYNELVYCAIMCETRVREQRRLLFQLYLSVFITGHG